MNYRKKPVEIQAIQWDGKNFEEIKSFSNGLINSSITERRMDGESFLIIPTLEGEMKANRNDYVIKGVKGEFYPCKPDIFEMTYEKI